ncbi:hypothetical protein STEG23_035604, partial [Scotinomys teguina]
FIYMVYYIDRLSHVEPSLHLWDKAYLVMVDNVFDVFLDCYISNFISDFINLDALSLCLLRKFHGVLRRSLKFILLDIRIATPACFLSPFDWKVFSQPFTLSVLIIMWREDFF